MVRKARLYNLSSFDLFQMLRYNEQEFCSKFKHSQRISGLPVQGFFYTPTLTIYNLMKDLYSNDFTKSMISIATPTVFNKNRSNKHFADYAKIAGIEDRDSP